MVPKSSTSLFTGFFDSERASGGVLIACTLLALAAANSALGPAYQAFWQGHAGGLTLEHWVNDALMAIFFLLIGLELERELYVGELSDLRNALLPILAALGGMVVPALIHFSLNAGTATQAGVGIPMATDIAFAIGVLAILGERVPASLKVFVVAFAVMDDLGAIVVIATFYSAPLSAGYLAGAIATWALLIALNRFRVSALAPYLLGGALLWFLMLRSGVHATIAGVMLAFAIPFSAGPGGRESPSHRLELFLQKPVAFAIMPVFVLANAGLVIEGDWLEALTSANALGIAAGLLIGKPLGITAFCLAAVASGLCRLPSDLRWAHVVGAGVLGGIGFTMSIFIANLAFAGEPAAISASKAAVLLASAVAGATGLLWLWWVGRSDDRAGSGARSGS